jgi:septum formation protein
MAHLILASSSPRRREILSSLGLEFEIVDPDVDESLRDDLPVEERVMRLAEDKAVSAARRLGPERRHACLGADTLVRVRGNDGGPGWVLGKPRDREDARNMIAALAGRTHDVHTGLALAGTDGRVETIRSDSRVSFAAMSETEIEAYLDTGDWEGVAGAYRIQGQAALFIERIEGSWSGIVGLPIRELYVILSHAGISLAAPAAS